MKRITIDIPEKEYKKLQLEALKRDIPVKIHIQNLIINEAKDKPSVELIKNT